MTDVEAKTPTKRKNSIVQEKKGSAKKPKLEGGKTPKKQISPKQQNKKQNISQQKLNTKKVQQKNDSPKKPKAFAGTKTINNEKTPKKNKEVEKKEGADGKRKRRSKAYGNLMNLIKVENKKEEALVIINEKLKEIQDRAELTKTGKKKMRLYLKLKGIAENKPLDVLNQQISQNKAKTGKADKKQGADSNIQKKQPQQVAQQSNKAKLNGKAKNVKPQVQNVQQKKVAPKQEDSDDDDEEDESDEEVDDEEDEEGEESDDEMDDEAEGELSDEEDEDESDEESEEEASLPPVKIKTENDNVPAGKQSHAIKIKKENNDKPNVKRKAPNYPIKIKTENNSDEKQEVRNPPIKIKTEKEEKNMPKNTVDMEQIKKNNLIAKNQKRFVLFVGNIPYDTTKQDLVEHFKKCGEIKYVRLPTEKKSSKPRGFGYVELTNEESYQKCLSMHHTFLKGRRINVLYTQGGKKKGEEQKKEIRAKNFKLHALRKQGKLAGSTKQNQKRSFRRAKQKVAVKTESEEQD